MPMHYSDPSRASEPHALPDVEVFHYDPWRDAERYAGNQITCDECGNFAALYHSERTDGPLCEECFAERHPRGWYWWPCLPGCLPDGDPIGPFATKAEALADAREGN